MIHKDNCRWNKTTSLECEYKNTHYYCPHANHECNCSEIKEGENLMQGQISLESKWSSGNPIGQFDNKVGNTYIGDPWYNPNIYTPIVERYYPVYYGFWNNEKNKTEQAFKIVQKLIDKGKLKVDTVKDFIEAVNEIVEVL